MASNGLESAPQPSTTDQERKTRKLKNLKDPKAKNSGASRKSRSPSSHPSYEEMIKDAITTLKVKTGSSQYAISKFNEEKHKELPSNFKRILLFHLKKLVASGKLVKVKGSFKLPPKLGSQEKNKPVAVAKPKPRAVANGKTSTKPGAIVKPKPKPKAATNSKAVAKPKLASSESKTKAAGKSKTTEKSKLEVKPAKAVRTSTRTSPGKKVPTLNPVKKASAKSVRLPTRRTSSRRAKK